MFFNGLPARHLKLRNFVTINETASADDVRKGMERVHQDMLDELNALALTVRWQGCDVSFYGFSQKHRFVTIHVVAGERPATLDDLRAAAKRGAA